jgi:hypothetical protein
MKKLLLTISLLLIFTIKGFSQFEGTIKLYVEDSIGQKDSVWLGIKKNSTLGIDSSFGEKNIFGTPFKDLDIRVIQRDSNTSNCLNIHINNKVIFSENSDSKIDFRAFAWPDKSTMNFEIIVHAINYPVKIKADLSNFKGTMYDGGWSTIWLLNKNCERVESKVISELERNELIISDSSNSIMIAQFDVLAGINENNTNINSSFNLYPNPFKDELKIESKNQSSNTTLDVKIYNLLGQIERVEKLNSNNSNINLTNLKPGIYFIEIVDNSHKIYRQKIIKY